MGIDYGEKKIGIAISDENGKIAMPFGVIANIGIADAAKKVKKLCDEKRVHQIVIGESKDFKGNPNPIMREITKFKELLAKEANLPISYHPEVLSTVEASRITGKNKSVDASAAAIVLQSFLDKVK